MRRVSIASVLTVSLALCFENCAFSHAHNYYHKKVAAEAARSRAGCVYFADGREVPKNGLVALGALLVDFGIGVAAVNQSALLGFFYFSLGSPALLAHRSAPLGYRVWCGAPEAPVAAPHDYYYVSDALTFWAGGSGAERKAISGCALNRERQERVLLTVLGENGLPFCTKDGCQREREFAREAGDRSLVMPAGGKILLVDEKTCVYAFYFPGGKEALGRAFVPRGASLRTRSEESQ